MTGTENLTQILIFIQNKGMVLFVYYAKARL